MGGSKRVNMKFWLGPDVSLAKKHKSFGSKDAEKALQLIRKNWEQCLSEWTELYGHRLGRVK